MSQDKVFFTLLLFTGCTTAVNVVCPYPRYVVILFQPVTLRCDFSTTGQSQPVISWKYKSHCRDPIQAALNPSSVDNVIAQSNPSYDPNRECSDSTRTVHIVASKQMEVTLGSAYQGRQISITNNADLNIAQTAWGDSGVYVCSVVSSQDLSGNGECYTELIVLERKSNTTDLLPGINLLVMEDWLLVVLVALGFLLLLFLIGICWCQCCPHTCCCYVSCPCCSERCCCPRALYEAGKMSKSGIPSQYAHTVYAQSMHGQPTFGVGGAAPGIPLLPMQVGVAGPPFNGYGKDFDRANSDRSGYRVQADQDGNPTQVHYYMEQDLANLDPSRPVNTPGRYSHLDGMSNVSSRHIRRDEPRRGPDYRGHEYATENFDDNSHNYEDRDDYAPACRDGRRGSDEEWSSSGRGYDRVFDDHRRRDYSHDARPQRRDSSHGAGFQGRRSHSRDDLMDLERDRGRGGWDAYDGSLLREAMEKKKLVEQQRGRSRERLDSETDRFDRYSGPHGGPPPLPLIPPSGDPNRHGNHSNSTPPPPPYTEDSDSLPSSKKSKLKKNGAVSRESMVV
ncbi:lipolysis-stimulated lipoprotein receptor-like isoform X1 [Carassius gibelio]|uniref:lipolysis-stimulated lipoprotein receptor-like isoform X1 n=1 Tax=Carassius gibelio TaxID=101364 RepID=UPI0022781AEB|nr:lipolysis-stimulated lipoprotein receptor-like isoform X1 [Carassius gibelio]